MQLMGDMGTQMTIQKIKSKCSQSAGSIRDTIAEVVEMFDEKDERFLKMG